jgi:hypothetical protein
MRLIIIKAVLFITITLSVILLLDTIDFFDSGKIREKNTWNYFYHYTEKINFDILLLGNSQLNSGIEPKYLCNILGVNAFMLAAPGTYISDTYFSLKETLTRTKPKLVIIDTYTILMAGKKSHEFKGQNLSDLFKSFDARKNFIIKLLSTPFLFKIDNYPFAWSHTVRNHDFLFNNYEQLGKNLDKWEKSIISKEQSSYPLYLGSYVHPPIGLQKDILQKYRQEGAPFDGSKTIINYEEVYYLEKINKLCEDNNVKLMFITIPVYYRYIKNYNFWKNVITEILSKIGKTWLNMQEPDNYKGFTEISFQNSYYAQHLTINGSITATYKLAEFIQKTYPNLLPDRKKETVWLNMFYGEDGYFENNSPSDTDKQNSVLLKEIQFENIKVLEADLLRKDRKFKLLIKISRENLNEEILKKSELIVTVEVGSNKTNRNIDIKIPYDELRTPENYAIFQKNIEPLKITKINNVKLITL